MWILDCKPEEIKHPFRKNSPAIEPWDMGKQDVLAHAHEIDIDELRRYVYSKMMPGSKAKEIMDVLDIVENYLQDKLKQEKPHE
jgi:hypothetical protein